MLFQERLAGNIGILVPVLEDDSNTKRMFLVSDLGDNPAEHDGIRKKNLITSGVKAFSWRNR